MVKLKVNQVRKHICPTCRGNGYLKVGTEWGETIHQCLRIVTGKGNSMRLQIIILVTLTVMILLLANCSRADYQLNPWTTVLREVIKHGE
jgi:hypothetical protein